MVLAVVLGLAILYSFLYYQYCQRNKRKGWFLVKYFWFVFAVPGLLVGLFILFSLIIVFGQLSKLMK